MFTAFYNNIYRIFIRSSGATSSRATKRPKRPSKYYLSGILYRKLLSKAAYDSVFMVPRSFSSFRHRKSTSACPKKYRKKGKNSAQSISSSTTSNSSTLHSLGSFSSLPLRADSKKAIQENLQKALIKVLPHSNTLVFYTMENQSTKQLFSVNYAQEFVD